MTKTLALLAMFTMGGLVACDDGGDDGTDGTTIDAAVGGADAMVGCAANYAGCATFEDHTADATFTVMTPGNSYSPKCIKVKAGTAVTITASGTHPFVSDTCNPTPLADRATADVTFTVNNVGTFGYYCDVPGANGGRGLAGPIPGVP